MAGVAAVLAARWMNLGTVAYGRGSFWRLCCANEPGSFWMETGRRVDGRGKGVGGGEEPGLWWVSFT